VPESKVFYFFGKAFQILQKFEEKDSKAQECAMVGATREFFVVAQKYKTAWIVIEAKKTYRYASSPTEGYKKANFAYDAAYKCALRDIRGFHTKQQAALLIGYWIRREFELNISNQLLVDMVMTFWIAFL